VKREEAKNEKVQTRKTCVQWRLQRLVHKKMSEGPLQIRELGLCIQSIKDLVKSLLAQTKVYEKAELLSVCTRLNEQIAQRLPQGLDCTGVIFIIRHP
jgi:hypothetical protein